MLFRMPAQPVMLILGRAVFVIAAAVNAVAAVSKAALITRQPLSETPDLSMVPVQVVMCTPVPHEDHCTRRLVCG